MAGEMERLNSDQVRGAIEHRFPQPHWLTVAGQQDRRADGEHSLAMREVGRRMELQAARTYERLAAEMVQLDADSRALSETKWRISRAQKESEVLAGENPELQAKFGILDDEFFKRRRTHLLFGLE